MYTSFNSHVKKCYYFFSKENYIFDKINYIPKHNECCKKKKKEQNVKPF